MSALWSWLDRNGSGLRLALLAALLGAGLVLAVAGSFAWLGQPRTYRLRMLADMVPSRQALARRIAADAAGHGLKIKLTHRDYGSLEALDVLNRTGEFDLALVPDGFGVASHPDVRLVTTLAIEPLQLFVRGDLAVARPDPGLAFLRGRQVMLEPATTATRVLAQDVLRFAGMDPPRDGAPGDYVVDDRTPEMLLALLAGSQGGGTPEDRAQLAPRLPDAVFLMAPVPSLLGRLLVDRAGFRPLPLPFAEAFAHDRLTDTALDRGSIVATDIPAYTYGVSPAVPAAGLPTLGGWLLLVARKDADPKAIERLVSVLFDTPLHAVIGQPDLQEQHPAFPLHAGTERYIARTQPLATSEQISNLGNAMGGLGGFACGVVAVWGMVQVARMRKFERYYREISRIELLAQGVEREPDLPDDPAERQIHLLDRLSELKIQALGDFQRASGNEALLQAIMALIADTRSSIARLLTGRPARAAGEERPAAAPTTTPSP